MGALLAKFRKHKTTEEVLDKLDEEIHQIEKYSYNTQEQKKRIVGNFLAISIGIYVIAFIVFYFVYFPPTWKERFIYSVPLFLFPLVIILLRKLFTWYFQRKLNKNSNKLTELRTEKKRILEQVMDKETYKVAVNLLARYGDKTSGNKYPFAITPRVSGGTQISVAAAAPLNQSRQQAALPSATSGNQLILSSNMRSLNASLNPSPRLTSNLTQLSSGMSAAGGARLANADTSRQLSLTPQSRVGQQLRRRTPFPIVNQQGKGVFERIVDVLIGDGPQDRFAMICKECFAHNGMALKEDFDYTTFRCAFCSALNQSRKERPKAPRLSLQHPLTVAAKHSSDSSSSSDIDSDSEPTRLSHQVLPVTATNVSSDTVPADPMPAAGTTVPKEITSSDCSNKETDVESSPMDISTDMSFELANFEKPAVAAADPETPHANDELKKAM